MELRGVVWFGVMEPLWAGWGCGVVGMAGCGVMELWGMAHSGAVGPQGCGSLWGDGAVGCPTMMELWGMVCFGVMDLLGIPR